MGERKPRKQGLAAFSVGLIALLAACGPGTNKGHMVPLLALKAILADAFLVLLFALETSLGSFTSSSVVNQVCHPV